MPHLFNTTLLEEEFNEQFSNQLEPNGNQMETKLETNWKPLETNWKPIGNQMETNFEFVFKKLPFYLLFLFYLFHWIVLTI